MTKAGWAFMAIAWTAVILTLSFCYYHVLKSNRFKDKTD